MTKFLSIILAILSSTIYFETERLRKQPNLLEKRRLIIMVPSQQYPKHSQLIFFNYYRLISIRFIYFVAGSIISGLLDLKYQNASFLRFFLQVINFQYTLSIIIQEGVKSGNLQMQSKTNGAPMGRILTKIGPIHFLKSSKIFINLSLSQADIYLFLLFIYLKAIKSSLKAQKLSLNIRANILEYILGSRYRGVLPLCSLFRYQSLIYLISFSLINAKWLDLVSCPVHLTILLLAYYRCKFCSIFFISILAILIQFLEEQKFNIFEKKKYNKFLKRRTKKTIRISQANLNAKFNDNKINNLQMLFKNNASLAYQTSNQEQNQPKFLNSVFPCCFSQRENLNHQKNSVFQYMLTGLSTFNQQNQQFQFSLNHPMHKNQELIKILNVSSMIKNKSGDLKNLAIQNCPMTTLLLDKQIIYQGRVLRGSANDENGLIVYPDGSYFKGRIKNGIIQGKGSYKFADQSFSYEGQWTNGLPNGFGKQIGPTGVYQGLFRNAKKWGNGKMTFQNGSIYMGSFTNNQICGNGTLYSQNSMAKGNWVNGFLQGVGVQKYNDSSQYIGQFHKGKPHGNGTFTLPNGKVYVGQFKNGKPVGVGKFYLNNREYPQNWDKQELLSISVTVQNTISNSGMLMGSINNCSRRDTSKWSPQMNHIQNQKEKKLLRNKSNFSKASKGDKRSISHRHQ